MKANELMIGDWVYITDHPMRKEVKQVKPEHLLRSLVTFEPILLTPEILKKNGFERENLITSYNHYIGIDNRVSLNDDFYCINSRNMWNVHIDSEDYCSIAGCELTYVHELQHLLKLCGINKEIVL